MSEHGDAAGISYHMSSLESTFVLRKRPFSDSLNASAWNENLDNPLIMPMQVRRRYQAGCLRVRGRRRKVWIGRWREDEIGPDGMLRRRHRSIVLGRESELTKREAKKLLEARLRPLNQGHSRPSSTMTFREFVRQKWAPVALNRENNSTQGYSSKLRCHLLPVFGGQPLNEIDRWQIEHFLVEKAKHGYSGAYLHGIRSTLSKILQAAVDWGYLLENPARGCPVKSRTPVYERVYLSPAQLCRLAASLLEPCRSVVLVAVLTGMRIGEILALRWERIDFLGGTITVAETYSEGRFGPPKTHNSERKIPLSTAVQDALLAQRGRSAGTGPNDLVFTTSRGTPLNSKNMLRRVLRPTCEKLGLPPATWHSFRHTHATLLSEVGTAPRVAQAILGHSDVGTTLNVYTHAVPESQRAAVEKVSALLFPNVPKLGVGEEDAVGQPQ